MSISRSTAKGKAIFHKESKVMGGPPNTELDVENMGARDHISSAVGYNPNAEAVEDSMMIFTENAKVGNGTITFDVDTSDYVILVQHS